MDVSTSHRKKAEVKSLKQDSLEMMAADASEREKSFVQNKKLLGERLVEANVISSDQLQLALREQRRAGGKLGEVLQRLGFVTPNIIASVLAHASGSEMIDLEHAIIYPEALELIPYAEARRHCMVPLAVENNVLLLAMANTYDVVAIDNIQRRTSLELQIVAAPSQEIQEVIEKAYNTTASIEDTIDLLLGDGDSQQLLEEDHDRGPMVRLAEQILMLAVRERATDIHIEPDELVVRIRFRVDGTVRQATVLPNALKLALIAVFKIMAGMDITEKRVPQDGRTSFQVANRKIDVRVSSLPTSDGENLVLRLLDKGSVNLNLDGINLGKRDRALVKRTVDSSFGMMLVAGPTGSGKTTTLYSAIKAVDALERSVFTLEDPIEYELPIIRQTQIHEEIGMDFASGLRSLLRQDPDVIMVGEMRDKETAQLAVRAALTGHLVFSTVHANNAVSVIPRLIDMGVEPYLIAAAQPLIVGQRLARRICTECIVQVKNPAELLEEYQLPIPRQEFSLYRGAGCERCSGTGYRGRIAFYETLKVTQSFHQAIVENDFRQLAKLAAASGMRTMKEDGLRKAIARMTTVEEVVRVVSTF